jgi:hypothetical protein
MSRSLLYGNFARANQTSFSCSALSYSNRNLDHKGSESWFFSKIHSSLPLRPLRPLREAFIFVWLWLRRAM